MTVLYYSGLAGGEALVGYATMIFKGLMTSKIRRWVLGGMPRLNTDNDSYYNHNPKNNT